MFCFPYLVGVEKLNDDARQVCSHKSNRRDACADVMLLESRQRMLQNHERQANGYTKAAKDHWERAIVESRKRNSDKSNDKEHQAAEKRRNQ